MPRPEKKQDRIDLRAPMIASAIIGFVLLVLCALFPLVVPSNRLWLFELAAAALYLITVGSILCAYLVRQKKMLLAEDTARLLTTEIGDMFSYGG